MDLRFCYRLLSVFHTAAVNKTAQDAQDPPFNPYQIPRTLPREEWLKAVLKGADENSPRWRHTIIIGGCLLGFESQERRGLSAFMRSNLEAALTKSVTMAVAEIDHEEMLGRYCVTFILNHTFELLSDVERSTLDYDALLPLIAHSMISSPEGLQAGYFLGAVDRDVVQVEGGKFRWSSKSTSFNGLRQLSSNPLNAALGPLSRLLAHSAESVRNSDLVMDLVGDLATFSRTLLVQWRLNKVCEVDVSEENMFLDQETLDVTLPVLWRLLKNSMFAIVVTLRSVLGRVLRDQVLASDKSKLSWCFRIQSPADSCRCTAHCYSDIAYPAQCILHISQARPKRIFAVYIRKSYRYRYPCSIPPGLRRFLDKYPAHRARPNSCSSCRTMSRPVLLEYGRALCSCSFSQA